MPCVATSAGCWPNSRNAANGCAAHAAGTDPPPDPVVNALSASSSEAAASPPEGLAEIVEVTDPRLAGGARSGAPPVSAHRPAGTRRRSPRGLVAGRARARFRHFIVPEREEAPPPKAASLAESRTLLGTGAALAGDAAQPHPPRHDSAGRTRAATRHRVDHPRLLSPRTPRRPPSGATAGFISTSSPARRASTRWRRTSPAWTPNANA